MKVKTSELTGAALDWMVAKCEGHDMDYFQVVDAYSPSTDWEQGGPIIERERIWLNPEIGKEGTAGAWYAVDEHDSSAYGPTPLVAAMRCLVARKIGDGVEVPEELL